TYTDRMSLYVDERELQLIHVPTAHTIDDTLVYLPDERLLFAGDIAFFYVTPLAFEGSIMGWLDAIDTVAGMGVERIVPGHGPLGTLDDLALLRGYFEHLRDAARRHYDAGHPAEQAIVEIDLGPYAAWGEPERAGPNVLRLYDEFAGVPWAPLDRNAVRDSQRAWLARPGCEQLTPPGRAPGSTRVSGFATAVFIPTEPALHLPSPPRGRGAGGEGRRPALARPA